MVNHPIGNHGRALFRCRPMPVPGLSLLGHKRVRGFVSILRYINPTIIIYYYGLGIFCCGQIGPLLQGQIRTAKLKSAYNLLIIGPRGLGW